LSSPSVDLVTFYQHILWFLQKLMDLSDYFDFSFDPDYESASPLPTTITTVILWDPHDSVTAMVLQTLWALFRLRNPDAKQKFPDVSEAQPYEHLLTPHFIRDYWPMYRRTLEPILTQFLEQKNAQLEFMSNRPDEPKYVLTKSGTKFLTSTPYSNDMEFDDVMRTLRQSNPSNSKLSQSSHAYVIQLIPISG
jgi:hypothetical protein